jgi:hypothetical protein
MTAERCTAFLGDEIVAAGTMVEVAEATRGMRGVLIFDDATSEELHPSVAQPRSPGRPKLGVVAREVTLLPRHWEWLTSQPGGASVALRKLVEVARRDSQGLDRRRLAREAVYRFISTMAGDAPRFEEAARALFAGDRKKWEASLRGWPKDVRAHALRISKEAFDV